MRFLCKECSVAPTNADMSELISPLPMIGNLSSTMPLLAEEIIFKSSGSKAVLIELYSAEDCSSCPPAEAWMSALKTSSDLWETVFPVVFHVDYCNGSGRTNHFAKPAYTQRQYTAHLGQNSPYCPEFITSGREWQGWHHGEQNPPPKTETSGELTLRVKDGGKNVSAFYTPTTGDEPQTYTINVALLAVNVLSDVQRSDEGGRQLAHDFVALDLVTKPLTKPEGFQGGLASLKLSPNEPAMAIAAWISASNGSILQVTGGWLKPSPSSVQEME
jgi:hypothetical protein